MSNSETALYDMSRFGSTYLLAGIETYFETAHELCQCDTLLEELDRLEAWEQRHGGFYDLDMVREHFADLRERIAERRAEIEAFESQFFAERARSKFTVVEGGKKV